MKKYFFFLIPIIIISLIACAQTKKSAKSTAKKMDIEYVMMRRTACFGKCPIYNIELYKDGRIKYTGLRFVKDSGVYEKNIGAAAAEKIFDKMRAYRIDTCSEKYNMNITDLPGIYFNYTMNNEERKIINANFGPSFLRRLAEDIDVLGADNHTGWKKND